MKKTRTGHGQPSYISGKVLVQNQLRLLSNIIVLIIHKLVEEAHTWRKDRKVHEPGKFNAEVQRRCPASGSTEHTFACLNLLLQLSQYRPVRVLVGVCQGLPKGLQENGNAPLILKRRNVEKKRSTFRASAGMF